MKKIILFLTLLAASTFAHANACRIKSSASFFLVDGTEFQTIRISDGYFYAEVESWEDCYNFAISKAENLPHQLNGTFEGARLKNGKQNATGEVFMSWSYEGLILHSMGKVTAQTRRVHKEPKKGDLRIRLDGTTPFN